MSMEVEHLAQLQRELKKTAANNLRLHRHPLPALHDEQWAAITLEAFRMLQAGLRYGWASRKLFEGKLTDEKVAALTGEALDAYHNTGLPQMTRYVPDLEQLSKSP